MKMMPKWTPTWSKKGAKNEPRPRQVADKIPTPLRDAKKEAKWTLNGAKMDPTRNQNRPKLDPKYSQNGTSSEPKSSRDEHKIEGSID